MKTVSQTDYREGYINVI